MDFTHIAETVEPGSKIISTTELEGGVSAKITQLTLLLKDSTAKKVVVRQYGAADLAHNAHVAATEYKLLTILQGAGLPTPKPYLYDESAQDSPYLVIEYIEGSTIDEPADLADYTKQLARVLARIHRANAGSTYLSFLPTQESVVAARLQEQPSVIDTALHEDQIREALQARTPIKQTNQSTLLHGDFWPGNTLWQDNELRAVIDWEDAAFGDPLSDLANACLEISINMGNEAMQFFKNEYLANMPDLDATNLPYWELYAALRPTGKWTTWGLSEDDAKNFAERHNDFTAQALAKS